MRISQRAKKSVEWVKANENKGGGLCAWAGFVSYPEVTGYIIPTLLEYGEKETARRFGDWLVSIQNKDGSFNGLDGIPRVFDTGAVWEGLTALGKKYRDSVDRAESWLLSQRLPNGLFRSQHDSERVDFYTARVCGLLGDKVQAEKYLNSNWFDGGKQRAHYLAYGWEGLHTAGFDVSARVGKISITDIAPAYVDREYKAISGTDTTATAQLGILRLKCGMDFDPAPLYALQMDNGAMPHDKHDRREISWAVKFFLDLERMLHNGN